MKKLLWATFVFMGLACFLGHYLNNPLPPDMEESWFYNLYVGLVAFTIDMVSSLNILQLHIKWGLESVTYPGLVTSRPESPCSSPYRNILFPTFLPVV